MDLIIVDQNSTFSQSLREYFSASSKFKNIIVFRTLKELLSNLLPQKGLLLFELSETNENYVEKVTSLNNNLIVVAISDVADNPQSLNIIEKGVSAILSKADKPEKISEQVDLIIEGKSILSKEIVENLKNKKNRDNTNRMFINKIVRKLFLL